MKHSARESEEVGCSRMFIELWGGEGKGVPL